jgi:hypothetical protein
VGVLNEKDKHAPRAGLIPIGANQANKIVEVKSGTRLHVTAARLMLLFLLALAIGPVFAVDIPAMRDYPNHLAVISVLSRAGTPAENPFYQVAWTFNTNIAMELVVPPLARLIGLAAAGKAFLLLTELLVIAGTMAIERVVRGRLELSPLAAAMFLYSFPFAWGFINFEFGLGVALCGIASWLATEGQRPLVRALLHSAFAAVLFVAHLLAFGIYGVTLGIHELWRWRSGQASVRQALLTMTVLATPAVGILAIMLIFGHSVAGATSETEWRFDLKPRWVFEAMNGYSFLLSSAGMCLLISGILLLSRRGYLKLAGSGGWIAVGFSILYLAVPNRLMETAFNDVRILTAAAFILPAFMRLSFPNRAWRQVAFWTAVVCALPNLILVWWVWLAYRPDYAAMVASFKRLAGGSTVLVADSYPPGKPGGERTDYPFYHAPTLAVAYANALVSSLFTYPGDRPVTLRSAYRQFAQPGFLSPKLAALSDIASGARNDAPLYLQSWPDKYDYVYVIGPPVPNPMPQLLHELDAGPRFALYEIDKSTKAH